ncbi:MAG: glycosyltransferase family 1 protein [candidate division WOR-3 bacterium]|nr:MAG: glycosyltransferase family 1 protein [candidate division WOR-3 bacterium]
MGEKMRVFFVCPLDEATTDYPLLMSKVWEREGHEVRLFPFDLEFDNHVQTRLWDALAPDDGEWRRVSWERTVEKACADYRPDIVLTGGTLASPEGVRRLRRGSGGLVGFILGYNHLIEGATTATIREADFVIVHDSYMMPVLQGARCGKRLTVLLLRSAADPEEHLPVPLSHHDQCDFGAEVAFIGGASANRATALCRLTRWDLRIWGSNEWTKVPGLTRCFRSEPVYGLKKTKIYNAAKIVLNIEIDEKQINAFSQRVPEVLACGGFVITEWRKDLESTALKDGESIVIYRSLDEMVEKVDYYLRHVEERRRIAENGRRIVLNSLTYRHTAVPLIEQIEGVLRGSRRGASVQG